MNENEQLIDEIQLVRELNEVAHSGNFIISHEAEKKLQKLIISIEHKTPRELDGDLAGYFDRLVGQLSITIDDIKKIAYKDLHLSKKYTIK